MGPRLPGGGGGGGGGDGGGEEEESGGGDVCGSSGGAVLRWLSSRRAALHTCLVLTLIVSICLALNVVVNTRTLE